MNYIEYAKKLLYISNQKIFKILPLIFLFLFASLIEFIGLGLIIPYITLIINPENFSDIIFLKSLNIDIEKNFDNFLIILSCILITVFSIKTILSIVVRWAITRFAFKQYANLQVRLMSAYQKMNYEDFLKRNASEYTRNVKELTSESTASIENFLRLVSEVIIFTAIILYLCFINFKIILILFLLLSIIMSIYEFYLKPKAVLYGKNKVEASSFIYRGVDSSVKGFKEIRLFAKEEFFLDILKKGALKIYTNELKQSWIMHSPRYIFELAIITFLLSFLSISIFLYKDINLVLPIIGVFAVAGVRLLPGAASIVNCFNFLNYSSKAVNTVYQDLKKLRKKNNNNRLRNIKSNLKKINFKSLSLKNIYYKYPNTKTGIIKDASINLKAKECVGIVGESGSGKTTIIDILLGLLKPHKGQILINDKKIDQNSNSFVKLISYLPQEPLILEDTIKANICLDNSINKLKSSNEKLNTAIVQANIKQFIKTLPKGINTRIGESGVRLSGGQNKRLAIARTFFHDKEIIVMLFAFPIKATATAYGKVKL